MTRSRRTRRFRFSCLAGGLAGGALLAACGDPVQPTAKEQQAGLALDQRNIPLRQSKIRTIRGVELDQLSGAAGEWARQEAAAREHKRRNQGWLQPVELDLGERPAGAKVIGTFNFRNPTSTRQTVKGISSSCGCQKVVLQIGETRHEIPKSGMEPLVVEPGAEGKLEAHIEIPDRDGTVFTEVRIETTDPDVPSVRVGVKVVPVREFIVESGGSPQRSIDFGIMSYTSQRDYEFIVKSRDKKPFTIEEHTVLPEGMHLTYAPVDSQKTVWKIAGHIGPRLKVRGFNGIVQFETDRKQGFDIAVYALVIPPIRVEPATALMFGIVSAKKGKTKPLALTAVDKSEKFRIERVETFDLPPKFLPGGDDPAIEIEAGQDSGWTTVRVSLPPGAKRGYFNFGLRIHFDRKDLEPREVRVIGHVR